MTSNELETILVSKECKTRASFERKLAEDADGMIVLDFFDHAVDEHQISPNGEEKVVQVINKAFVFSSPRLLFNIKRSVQGKRGDLNVMADGTFQLSNCRWVLVDVGTTSLVYSKSPKHITNVSCLLLSKRTFQISSRNARTSAAFHSLGIPHVSNRNY